MQSRVSRFLSAMNAALRDLLRGEAEAPTAAVTELQLLLEGISDYGLLLLDMDGRVTNWTSSAEKLFGYGSDEALTKSFTFLYPDEPKNTQTPQEELEMAAAHGRFEDTAWRRRKDGSVFWAEAVICPLRRKDGQIQGFSQIVRDVSERKKSSETLRQKEEELEQARKMEAIGRLAGGVAHDFNNFVTGIIGLAEDLYDSLDAQDPRRADMEEIIKTADRARILTRELLAFGRRQVSMPAVLETNRVISDSRKMLIRLLGADITLETKLDPQVGNILIDPTQLDQVLVNLVANARDAMPDGGSVEVATRRFVVQEAADQRLPTGRYVEISVRDTGTGMNDDVLAHLFEPFFTTKDKGRGTGLGLATVYGIVKQNHGDITVTSQLGGGTLFRVYLPEVDAPAHREVPVVAGSQLSGSETILIVEDEDLVRRVAQRALEQRGYRVLLAPSGPKALAFAESFDEPIHLLLTDVVMPEMNGRDLADRFLQLHPEADVLYMSAYSEEVIHQRGILASGLAFIEKPFTKDRLAQKVAEVLRKPSPTLPIP